MIPVVKKAAVIYVRFSSDEQVENTSLQNWGKLRLRLQAAMKVSA